MARVCFDTGSFTDAAIELGVSQAAVSRTLLSLEAVLGIRLLHRTSRSVSPTTAGVQVLARARQLLAEADNLAREATTGHTRRRIGHAWSAMGRHTLEFQRRWADRYPDVELQLIRANSATGGLSEGQYRRHGIAFRPLRDASPVPVLLIWRRHDPHPATHAAVALASDLYRS